MMITAEISWSSLPDDRQDSVVTVIQRAMNTFLELSHKTLDFNFFHSIIMRINSTNFGDLLVSWSELKYENLTRKLQW